MNERAYLLGCVMEECAELAVAISKVQRDDETDSEPFIDEATGFFVRIGNNIKTMEEEYNDLLATLELLHERTGIALIIQRGLVEKKKAKLKVAMAYSRERGLLTL